MGIWPRTSKSAENEADNHITMTTLFRSLKSMIQSHHFTTCIKGLYHRFYAAEWCYTSLGEWKQGRLSEWAGHQVNGQHAIQLLGGKVKLYLTWRICCKYIHIDIRDTEAYVDTGVGMGIGIVKDIHISKEIYILHFSVNILCLTIF